MRFEALLERARRQLVETQGLIEPVVLELPPDLRPVLDGSTGPRSRELGYDVEPFGGGCDAAARRPGILGTRDPGPSLERLLRDLKERETTMGGLDYRDRLAATLACHSASAPASRCPRTTMTAIVRDLPATAHPTLCPHGRPTIVRVPKDELSRWFGRTGWRRQ